jgi:putative transposase
MHKIDEIYTKYPYYGVPRMTAQLRRENKAVNPKRIRRLMKIMGIEAIYPKKNTSISNTEHAKYPYLLKNLDITHPTQIYSTDITYIRLRDNWAYLVAIIDWYSRYVLSWRLSETMHTTFCIDSLKEALGIALPEFYNTDQGSQFTSNDYIAVLETYPDIKISMDGKGRCFDNIFVERLWRTVKYEEVYIKDYRTFKEANSSLDEYFQAYNNKRLHSSLEYQTPAEVFFRETAK